MIWRSAPQARLVSIASFSFAACVPAAACAQTPSAGDVPQLCTRIGSTVWNHLGSVSFSNSKVVDFTFEGGVAELCIGEASVGDIRLQVCRIWGCDPLGPSG